MTIVNPAVGALLESPLHRLLSRALILLTITGRRSGRRFTFPVQYARDGDTVWIVPGRHERKTWWRNLLEPAPVELLIERKRLTGTGQAFLGDRDPKTVEAGMRVYLERFPKVERRLPASTAESAIVRIDLRDE